MTVYVPEEFTPERGRRPPALLHQPRRPGVRAGQPARGGQGRACSPATAAAPRACAGCSSTSSSASSTSPATSGSTPRSGSPGRGALREGVPRVRRRLGRPARRRPPGLRTGLEPADQDPRVGSADELPRAEHPLHRLRRPPRGALPLLPRPGGARPPGSAPATSATWTGCSTPTACCSSGSPSTSGQTVARQRRRLRLRVPPGHPGQGARRGARGAAGGVALERRASTAAARPSKRCCCGCARIRCPRRATTPS